MANIRVYLSPAAPPVSGNVCAAPHYRQQENKSACSTSCSPLQKCPDRSCPQRCLPAEHTKEYKYETTRTLVTAFLMNLQTCAVLAGEILVFAVRTQHWWKNHLFPQPARNEWMDGLVIFLALLYQHLLCNVQQEGTRKWRDSTHNTADRKKQKGIC